jgi:hypothetical protein
MENKLGTQLETFIRNMVRNKINVAWLSKNHSRPMSVLAFVINSRNYPIWNWP